MTNEELKRVMNSIIERQERITIQQEQTQTTLDELAHRDADKEERIKRFEQSYAAISDLLQRHDSQLATLTDNATNIAETQSQHDERIKRFERSYAAISNLLQRHDSQLVILTENANKTNEVVAGLAVSIIETNEVVAGLAVSIIETKEVVAGLAVSIAKTNATVDRLGVTVDRYIAALGNGSNGSHGRTRP
ncbi:MAG: hypothetical protein MSG64_11895 [Pyrinomonadaceae bacterium MAG19_C2-C3]|nr:hypothetical protein [Pyrinomonadaceae bacterium MAG19_C2-C3]